MPLDLLRQIFMRADGLMGKMRRDDRRTIGDRADLAQPVQHAREISLIQVLHALPSAQITSDVRAGMLSGVLSPPLNEALEENSRQCSEQLPERRSATALTVAARIFSLKRRISQ